MQVFDGYFVKYFASVVALLVYAAPIYFKDPAQRGSRDDITQDYIRSMRLLQNTSKGVGDLVLVYKRITGLAGHTSRVAELLEQVPYPSAAGCCGCTQAAAVVQSGIRKQSAVSAAPAEVPFCSNDQQGQTV